jgi:hypothetical protein
MVCSLLLPGVSRICVFISTSEAACGLRVACIQVCWSTAPGLHGWCAARSRSSVLTSGLRSAVKFGRDAAARFDEGMIEEVHCSTLEQVRSCSGASTFNVLNTVLALAGAMAQPAAPVGLGSWHLAACRASKMTLVPIGLLNWRLRLLDWVPARTLCL